MPQHPRPRRRAAAVARHSRRKVQRVGKGTGVVAGTTAPVSPIIILQSPTSVATGTSPVAMPSASALGKPSPKAELSAITSSAGSSAGMSARAPSAVTLAGKSSLSVPRPISTPRKVGRSAMAARKVA